MDTDTPSTECEQLPSCVRATILMSGGELAILDGDRTDLLCAMSIEHPCQAPPENFPPPPLEAGFFKNPTQLELPLRELRCGDVYEFF